MSYLIVTLVPLLISLILLALPDFVCKGVRYIYSLVVALILYQQIPLVDSGLLSYIIWLAIVFGFYAVAVRLPRSQRAFSFSGIFFFVSVASMLVSDFLIHIITPDITVDTEHYLLLFLAGGIGSGLAPIRNGADKDFSMIVLRGFDRIIAAAIMGITVAYFGKEVFSYEVGNLIFWILTAAITAAWFAIDIFAYEWTRRFSVAHFEVSPEVQAAIEKEWQEYENLSPEEKAQVDEKKRQDRLLTMRNEQLYREIREMEWEKAKAQRKQLRKEERIERAKERAKERKENAKYKEILERERDREIQRQIDRDRYGW